MIIQKDKNRCNKHDWQPWDSGRGILYCRNCNSRISKAELSFQEKIPKWHQTWWGGVIIGFGVGIVTTVISGLILGKIL